MAPNVRVPVSLCDHPHECFVILGSERSVVDEGVEMTNPMLAALLWRAVRYSSCNRWPVVMTVLIHCHLEHDVLFDTPCALPDAWLELVVPALTTLFRVPGGNVRAGDFLPSS